MRQIGTLPKTLDPGILTDYLLSQGIKIRVDDTPEGWHLWVYNEDHFPKARDELQNFVSAPDAEQYREASKAADAVRLREQRLEKQFRKNDRSVSDLWSSPGFGRRPLTMTLVAICVVVFLLQNSGTREWVHDKLSFAGYYYIDPEGHIDDGLSDLKSGEIWRLVTPIFMHVNILHIFFNMSCLTYFGTMIELRRGTLRLLILVLISAVLSNVGQFIWMERTLPGKPHFFEGMSGVGYALFGYIWMKTIYEPEQGILIHPNNVNIMLGWLVLCMTGVLGPIANAAHFVGLAVGVVFGILRY